MQPDDEKTLMVLYHRRQELLRELNDIDVKIRGIEIRTSRKERAVEGRVELPAVSSSPEGNVQSSERAAALVAGALECQEGYRTAQLYFEEASQSDSSTPQDELARRASFRHHIVQETFQRAAELMVDQHGNYYMQRFISLLKAGGSHPASVEGSVGEEAEGSELLALLDVLGGDLPDIACNVHGTRAVQRLVDVLASPEEFELFSDLIANDLVAMIKDLNGNHVVLRLLLAHNFVELGSNGDDAARERGQNIRKDVYHIIATNCVEICVNRQGCCIIQRCLQSAPEPFRTEIINVALNNVLPLVQDPFGNYVIQYILDLQQQAQALAEQQSLAPTDAPRAIVPSYTNRVIRQMLHHIAALSCNKFGSNVIEKCFKSACSEVRQLLIDELTDPHAMPKLLTDSFANYVVQTAIAAADEGAQFHQLRDAILPLQHLLRNSPYGVKIEAKLVKRTREVTKKARGTSAQQGKKRRGGRAGPAARSGSSDLAGAGGDVGSFVAQRGAAPPSPATAPAGAAAPAQVPLPPPGYLAESRFATAALNVPSAMSASVPNPSQAYAGVPPPGILSPHQLASLKLPAAPAAPNRHPPASQHQQYHLHHQQHYAQPAVAPAMQWPSSGYTAVQRSAAQHQQHQQQQRDLEDGAPNVTVKVTHSPYSGMSSNA